jgi:hypothetical protein
MLLCIGCAWPVATLVAPVVIARGLLQFVSYSTFRRPGTMGARRCRRAHNGVHVHGVVDGAGNRRPQHGMRNQPSECFRQVICRLVDSSPDRIEADGTRRVTGGYRIELVGTAIMGRQDPAAQPALRTYKS